MAVSCHPDLSKRWRISHLARPGRYTKVPSCENVDLERRQSRAELVKSERTGAAGAVISSRSRSNGSREQRPLTHVHQVSRRQISRVVTALMHGLCLSTPERSHHDGRFLVVSGRLGRRIEHGPTARQDLWPSVRHLTGAECSERARVFRHPPTRGRAAASPDLGLNAIHPSSAQLPPRSSGASQSATAAPPLTGIFFSFPSAKNPIH